MNLKLKGIFATILSLMIICITSSVFAADVTVGGLSVSADANVTQGKEFTVKINLSNFETSAQAVVISGKIEYDKDKLEYVSNSLTSNSANGWTVTFSDSKMVFLSENMNPTSVGKNSNMLTLKFKAKSDVEGTASIKVTSTTASDATNFNGGSTSVTISKPVEEQGGNQDDEQSGGSQDEEQGGNQGNEQGGSQGEEQGGNQGNEQGGSQGNEQGGNQGNGQSENQGSTQGGQQSQNQVNNKDTSKEDNTTKKGSLPATGENNYLKILIVSFAAIAAISLMYFIKIKNKKVR